MRCVWCVCPLVWISHAISEQSIAKFYLPSTERRVVQAAMTRERALIWASFCFWLIQTSFVNVVMRRCTRRYVWSQCCRYSIVVILPSILHLSFFLSFSLPLFLTLWFVGDETTEMESTQRNGCDYIHIEYSVNRERKSNVESCTKLSSYSANWTQLNEHVWNETIFIFASLFTRSFALLTSEIVVK